MKPIWKQIYPSIVEAASQLTVDSFLRQAVEVIAATYQAECLLWANLAAEVPDSLQVYAATKAAKGLEDGVQLGGHLTLSLSKSDLQPSVLQSVWQFSPDSLPPWIAAQRQSPQLVQLETGELIVPILSRDRFASTDLTETTPKWGSTQFVLQLKRTLIEAQMQAQSASPLASSHSQETLAPILGWSPEEIASVEVVCSQMGLAYSVVYWRQRLEQSRQQGALIGRIARLLNSSLNPDEIVGQIVAELGQGLQSDRCLLLDLRDNPFNILAMWDHPDRDLVPLEQRQVDRALWQNVVEIFLQGGASYLEVALTDPDPEPLQSWIREVGAVSMLMVPLFIQTDFFGAVALLSYRQRQAYPLEQLQTVRQVADQVAIALTNAQHYQSLWYKQEALRMQNSPLQQETVRDELTQLMNRRSLERELEQLSTRAIWTVQPPFSVIVCDIDYFKLVNDTHGYRVGDEVLQNLAQRLHRQLRRETPAYRYGGEEFVMILAEADLTKAIDVAERLRQAIRSVPVQTAIGSVEVTASFGIAQQNPIQDRHAWDVLQRADQALHEAKRQGRDRVQAL